MAIMLSDNDKAFTIIKDSVSDPDLWPRRSLSLIPRPRNIYGNSRDHIRDHHGISRDHFRDHHGNSRDHIRDHHGISRESLHIREAHPSFAVLGRTHEDLPEIARDVITPSSDTDTV